MEPPPRPRHRLTIADSASLYWEVIRSFPASLFGRGFARTALGQEQLSSTLKGSLGEQVSWTNEALRRHALRTVTHAFNDDFDWCMQVVLAIHQLDPQTAADIDRIVAEHVESIDGRFPSELYEGRGWNPGLALQFAEDGRFWSRFYRMRNTRDWFSVEKPTRRNAFKQAWEGSGYRIEGTRGCATTISFRRLVPLNAEQAKFDSFSQVAGRIVRRASGVEAPQDLLDAVAGNSPHDQRVGPFRLRFTAEPIQPDPGDAPLRQLSIVITWA